MEEKKKANANILGVIFDMDGLMFDTERLWDPLWEPACRELGLQPPDEAFRSGARGLAGENMKAHIRAQWPGCDADQLLQVLWKTGEIAFASGVPKKPGLTELLDWLEAQGMPRIVASSSPRAIIERNLQTTGTARYFHDTVCGADVARSKPDPAIFLEAARRLNLPPQRCLVLEDSFNGVRAGAAADCVTVMVPDLMQPDDEMRTLYTACCPNLFAVKAMLADGRL